MLKTSRSSFSLLKAYPSAVLISLLLLVASTSWADVIYSYDDLGRLIEAQYSDGSRIEYSYDANGNRTQKIRTANPSPDPLTINTLALPSGIMNQTYEALLSASGGNGNYSWSVISGQLPSGLSLTDDNITGTPTLIETAALTIAVSDGVNSVSQVFNLVIADSALPQLTAPAPGYTLLDTQATFQWDANTLNVSDWQLHIGSTPGLDDIHNSGSLGSNTSTTVNALPSDGSELFVTLWYFTEGMWSSLDASYRAMVALDDVTSNHDQYAEIQAMMANGIAANCASSSFCPRQLVTRATLAIWLLRAMHGDAYTPPSAGGIVYNDVNSNDFAADWIEQLANEGITQGCGNSNYCPSQFISRSQIAALLLRAVHSSTYTPNAASGNVYSDIAINDFAADWIEQLANDNISQGCNSNDYCPHQYLTRASLAGLIARAFDLVP